METLYAHAKDLKAYRVFIGASLAASKHDNEFLREFARTQQLSLANPNASSWGLCYDRMFLSCSGVICFTSAHVFRSFLIVGQTGEHSNPLSTSRIHLSSDWNDRKITLLGIKDHTINQTRVRVHKRVRRIPRSAQAPRLKRGFGTRQRRLLLNALASTHRREECQAYPRRPRKLHAEY